MKRFSAILISILIIMLVMISFTACNTSAGIVTDKYVGSSPMNGHVRYYVIVEHNDGETRYIARDEGIFNTIGIGDTFHYNPLRWLLDGSKWQKLYI